MRTLNNKFFTSGLAVVVSIVLIFTNSLGAYAQQTPVTETMMQQYGVTFLDKATCSPTGSTATPTGKLFMIGDSLTVGMRDIGKIQDKLTSAGWDVAGIDARIGRPLAGEGLSKIEENAALITQSSTVIIGLGTNDAAGSVEQFGTNVTTAVDSIKQKSPGASIFWINFTGKMPAFKTAEFSAKLAVLSQQEGFTVIDWATTGSQYIPNNDVHPNLNNGYSAMADLVVSGLTGNAATFATQSVTGFSPDPAAVEIYNTQLKPKIEPLVPLYQAAAKQEGITDWQILPALHNLEWGLRRDNPTTNTGFRTPFQMSASQLRGHGLNINDPVFTPGHVLTDSEFIMAAGYAIRYWLIPNGRGLGIDATKPMTPEQASKIIVAYKSGAGSVWFTGRADFNLHAYAWAGYDTTPEHKLPMAWGPGSPYGDEQAGRLVNSPGAATLFGILKGGDFANAAVCEGISTNGGAVGEIAGTKAELAERILSSPLFKWGNYGNATTQKSDVAEVVNHNMLKAMTAMMTLNISIPINAIKSDHSCGTLHCLGRAVDIGYYGSGNANFSPVGEKLYRFIYENRVALKVDELIWKDPPTGIQCVKNQQPVDCYAIYGNTVMSQHYHHIHMGVKED